LQKKKNRERVRERKKEQTSSCEIPNAYAPPFTVSIKEDLTKRRKDE
jgi:hypothetical protein